MTPAVRQAVRPLQPDDTDLHERYMPLVRRIAMKAIRSLPVSISLDDILSVGWLGMATALQRRAEHMTEDQFQAYASHRIRGAILDYLRSLDPLSRKLRGASRRITSAINSLTIALGRAPSSEEIAVELGMTLDQYYQVLAEIADLGLACLDLAGHEPEYCGPSPEALASKHELIQTISRCVVELPERLQLVLGLHYQENCTLREIGEVIGVTESRACQLHAEAVHRIRAHLQVPGSKG